MDQNKFDNLVKETVDFIENNGVFNSIREIKRLYDSILSNIKELPQIKLKQLAGTAFASLSYIKMPGMTKFPYLAYYCLTSATKVCPPFLPIHLIPLYIMHSRVERTKFLLNGGIKIIQDNIFIIEDVPQQTALDFAILGDVILLKKEGYNSREDWWKRALEDADVVKDMYKQYSDSDIVFISKKVHDAIADKVYKDLVLYTDMENALEEGWKIKD